MRPVPGICIGLALLSLTGCAAMREAAYKKRFVGQQAHGFKLQSLDGAEVELGAYKGKPVVLAFFAYG